MKKNILRWTTAGAVLSSVASGAVAAQSADALIDKLVDKGILTTEEASELRKESDQDFEEAYRAKNGLPTWVTALKLNGDFRGRFEGFYAGHEGWVDRSRWRYRVRVGLTAVLRDNFEVGLRLGSGNAETLNAADTGINPISNNQTLQNNGSKKGIFIDLVYGKWAPINTPLWSGAFTIGKMENPYRFSDMIFDHDYTPEGAAAQFAYNLSERQVARLNTAGFVLDEIGGSNNDPYMFGAQLRLDSSWTDRISSSAGVAGLLISNAAKLGTAEVPDVNTGNTRAPVYNAAGNVIDYVLTQDYNPVVVDASLTYTFDPIPLYRRPFPVALEGDYVYNPGAREDNEGYSVGVRVGQAGKKGTWELAYRWKYLEADAWYEEVTDSDFGAYYGEAAVSSGVTRGNTYESGTNVKGHIVKLTYAPTDFLALTGKWFGTTLVNASPPGSNSGMNRVQVDAALKF